MVWTSRIVRSCKSGSLELTLCEWTSALHASRYLSEHDEFGNPTSLFQGKPTTTEINLE
jgi:hypothetical protein